MGYYTMFDLKVREGKQSIQEIIAEINEENSDILHAVDDVGDYTDSCKWYDHEANMLSISEKYPDTVFVLKGEGEEAGDIWHKYFKNGKMQNCPAKITFEEYDERKLR
jgi:hypothetical protein